MPKQWPSYIKKSDEIRIESMPFILDDREARFEVTEKLDGSSASYGLDRPFKYGGKYDFAVCSRNQRVDISYEIENDDNVWRLIAKKYNIEEKMTSFANEVGAKTLYIQGEIISSKIQGNPYKLPPGEIDFYIYRIVVDREGYSYQEVAEWAEEHDMKSVPLLETSYSVPDNMENMKEEAEGMSEINPKVKREGLVYRHIDDAEISFKNVSNSYLLKHS